MVLDITNVDDVAIFHGFSSYAMFGAEEPIVQKIVDNLNSLKLIPTDKKIDIQSMYSLNFSSKKRSEIIVQISIDEKGILRKNGEAQAFEVSSGKLDYEYIEKIYQGSKN